METNATNPDPTAPVERLLYPLPEVRKMLGDLSHSGLYKLFGSGAIRVTKIGRRSYVTAEEIRTYVARISGQAPDEESRPARADEAHREAAA